MSLPYDPKRLYETLVELAIIPQAALSDALHRSETRSLPLEDVLLERDLISDENLGKTIAEILDLPFVRLASTRIDPDVLTALPEEYARRHGVILFGIDKDAAHLASSGNIDPLLLAMIERKLGRKATSSYATTRDMEYAMGTYERDFQHTFDSLVGAKAEKGQDDTLVITLINRLITYAYNNRASDIHIEAEKDDSVIRLRIDGSLVELVRFPSSFHQRFVARIKYLAKLRTDEHMAAQDGKFQISLDQEDLDLRVSIVPVTHGEKCVLRLLALRYRQFGLTDLGLSNTNLEKIERASRKPYGMILSTGPTGSGKTTSMYAIVKLLNTNDRNITTIEDPVEYDIDGINQIQVNEHVNLSFAEGLRSILRQDPNVIYVGEIRDDETASIAVNSALTGHLVLSTLHTNDAATALPRFLEMDIEPYLVASTVTVIIAQRLVRKLCQSCRVSELCSTAEMKLQIPPSVAKQYLGKEKQIRLYRGKGCPACRGTGYSGRIGLFEVLEVSPAIRQLIVDKADADALKNQAVLEGMQTMLSDGLEKAMRGITSLEEVLRTTRE